jgi:hypothetical protein
MGDTAATGAATGNRAFALGIGSGLPVGMSVFIVLAMIVVVIGIAAFDRRDVRE